MYPKSEQVLGILHSYAPDDSCQQLCTDLYNDAVREATRSNRNPEDELVLMVCGWITNGLRWGNWPWNLKAFRQ